MKPRAAFAAALLAACGAPRARAPMPAPQAARATPPPAPTPALSPDASRREAVLAAWRAAHPNPGPDDAPPVVVGDPIDYPEEGAAGSRAAGVVASGTFATLVVTPVPHVEERQATATLQTTGAPAETIAGLAARDVNGDGRADVAVFLRREYELDGYAPLQHLALFYTPIGVGERGLAALERAEVELLGVRDDAGLAAAIPTLGRYEAPREGLSPARFIARLRYATPAELREAVAPAGLRLCTDTPDRTGARRKRCTLYSRAQLTDAFVTGRVREALGAVVEVRRGEARGLAFPSCRRVGRELRCGANAEGPAGVDWTLVGEGASLRLVEVSDWAETSGR